MILIHISQINYLLLFLISGVTMRGYFAIKSYYNRTILEEYIRLAVVAAYQAMYGITILLCIIGGIDMSLKPLFANLFADTKGVMVALNFIIALMGVFLGHNLAHKTFRLFTKNNR